MQKIFLTSLFLIIASLANAEDKQNLTHIQKTNAAMQKEIPAEHKDIANQILDNRRQLADKIQHELEEFSQASKEETKKAYKSLSAEAKKVLKKENALKKKLSREAKKNVNLLIKNFKATSETK